MLLFDVDLLILLNDVIGHVATDARLVAMARLVVNDAEGGLVCPWGGDKFAVLVNDAARAESIGDRIRISMARAFVQERATATAARPDITNRSMLTFSVGAAKVVSGLSVSQLLDRCEEAVYRAKRAGGNRLCWASDASV